MPTGTLSGSGKKLWEKAYKDSKASGDDKETAAKKAWGAVKAAGWKKTDGKWSKKSDAIAEMSMYITKSSMDGKAMKWAAVNSDTDYDSYQERMSVDLYKSFIENIRNKTEVPQEYKSLVTSDYWRGGMPYLSISHYPDLNGDAVPGEPSEIFVDGNKLKAKGILFDSPLGHSVFRSLKEDKLKPPEERIRISIGFLDLSHRHGDSEPWVRESAYSLCSQCLEGVGDKVYVKGYLVHLALTRVPVNTRTEMVLEEKSMAKKITRKDDAASIVGKNLAEEIEAKQSVSKQRSDALIEMSETEEETQELIAEIEKPSDDVEVPAEEKVEADVEKVESVEKAEVVTEKFEDSTMDAVVNEPETYVAGLPFGGATTMRDAENYVAAKNEAIYLMDMWQVFSSVAWNIMERSDITDKRGALNVAVDEFKNVLTAKAMLAFSVAQPEATPSHELQPVLDSLLEVVDNSIASSEIERAEHINPELQKVGMAITDYLAKKSVVQNEPPAPDKNNDNLLENIKQLVQPLAESVKSLSEEVGMLKAKSVAQNVGVKSRIPQPRTQTIPPSLVAKSEPTKPGSLRAIINKSVGLSENA